MVRCGREAKEMMCDVERIECLAEDLFVYRICSTSGTMQHQMVAPGDLSAVTAHRDP